MGRRQITAAVTMLVLIGLLVLGAVWGWRALFAEVPGDATALTPSPTCVSEAIAAGEKIRADQVRVSVFNGGTRSGLAGETLDALMDRGFLAGDTANAPSDVDVARVEVWSTVEKDPRAQLVARQFGKNVKVRFSDEDLGPGIDVIVGDRFDRLARAPRALAVGKAQEICVPIESSEPAG